MSLLLPAQPPLGTATLSLLRVPRPQMTPPASPVGTLWAAQYNPGEWASAAERSLVSASRGRQSLWPCGPARGFPRQRGTCSTHPPLHSLQARSGKCCRLCESRLGTRQPCFRPPDAQMLLLQGGGWELKQVVEGVGRDTRKREGQRVGEGAGGSFSAGDCAAGVGAGAGTGPKPAPRQTGDSQGAARGCRLGEQQLRTHQ